MSTKWFAWDDKGHPAPGDRDFYVQLSNGYATRARLVGERRLKPDAISYGADGFGEQMPVPIAWSELPKPFKSPRGSASKDRYTPEFEVVWSQYPAPRNSSKWDAFRAYRNLTDAEQKIVQQVMPTVAREMAGRDPKYIPHLSTWLNGKRFETVRMPVPRASVHAGENLPEEGWRKVVDIWRRTENWNVMAYGPPPGKPGCRVPPGIL